MKRHLRVVKSLSKLLDHEFKITGVEFGIDPILDIIPGLGDILGALLSLYIVWIAKKLELPREDLVKMLRNVAIDFIVGILPVVGPIGDLFYKANKMNIVIIEKFLDSTVEGEVIKD